MKNMEKELRKAIALTYKEGQYAPQVVAKGRGITAEAIIACAKEAGIYVHEAPELVSLLMRIDIDQFIPPELYYAVAELLAWIYWLENRDEHLTKPT
jgi:flagellar biosynthesis protein